MYKKVSIITPCYNSENFLDRYLDSVFNQTYKNIELILINDGSTDKTGDIINDWIPKFKEQGIEIIYLHKKNGGAASAINMALKVFTGYYLTWPDSDDILDINSIKEKVDFLEENKQYALVRSDAKIVNEKDINKVIGSFAKEEFKYKSDLFDDCIYENNFWFAPGCFMVRSEEFIKVNPHREIYESTGGQNWQMLLPVLYNYKCGYIDQMLYTYVIRYNSHSHSLNTLQSKIDRTYIHQDIIINTIDRIIDMNNIEKDKYSLNIKAKYFRKRIELGFNFYDKNIVKENYYALKELNLLTKKDIKYYIFSRNKLVNKLTLLASKILYKILR